MIKLKRYEHWSKPVIFWKSLIHAQILLVIVTGCQTTKQYSANGQALVAKPGMVAVDATVRKETLIKLKQLETNVGICLDLFLCLWMFPPRKVMGLMIEGLWERRAPNTMFNVAAVTMQYITVIKER